MGFTIDLWTSQTTHQDKYYLDYHVSKNSGENRSITLSNRLKNNEICEIHKLIYEIHKIVNPDPIPQRD